MNNINKEENAVSEGMLLFLKKLVIFDLDGTLNQIHLFSVPAHLQTMREMGIPLKSEEIIISTFGQKSCDSAFVLAPELDDQGKQDYWKRVAALENENIVQYGKPYDGIPEMLKSLVDAGYELAVCSNASERYIRMVLETLRLISFITYIQPKVGDLTKVGALKILLDQEKPDFAIMVGDRKYDFDAACGNDIPFIGCLYGYCSEEVKDADIPVEKPSEIPEAANRLWKKVSKQMVNKRSRSLANRI